MNTNDTISCMNLFCHCTNSYQWMTGWPLKGGIFARLCFICGSAYANSVFCQTFHLEEPGWMNCRMCGKEIHCGCIASKHMFEYLDLGGVWCKTCQLKDAEHRAQVSKVVGTDSNSNTNASSRYESQPYQIANNGDNTVSDKGKFVTSQEPGCHCSQTERRSTLIANNGTGHNLGSFESSSIGPQPTPIATNVDNIVNSQMINAISSTKQITREQNAQILGEAENMFIRSLINLQNCPPSLAKYLPKVSNEELHQIFAPLNTHVVPLFEKVLSATDASRVGRMILPKICAMTYLPYLSESSGVLLNLLDSNGKTWNFQLRYWNNTSSRMYVFEGIHEYILEMGLQARDTVIFGLIYPNRLVIGFKKIPRDARECEITWRQAQFLLQPDPESVRNIFMIEGQEIEAYDKPPIIGNMEELTTPVLGPSNPAPVKRVELERAPFPDLNKPMVVDDESCNA